MDLSEPRLKELDSLDFLKLIKEKSYSASKDLAQLFGEPKVLKGTGRRNTTLNAIAQTTSSAFILGQVSQGIEPIWSNIYVKDIAKTKTTIKNPFLISLLERKAQNNKDTWNDVTRRETLEGAEKAIDASIEHYAKKLEFINGPKVVKTFK